MTRLWSFLYLLCVPYTNANNELIFTDAETRLTNLQTLFTHTDLLVSIPRINDTSPTSTSSYQIFVDDQLYSSGILAPSGTDETAIPLVVGKRGSRTIRVDLQLVEDKNDGNVTASTSKATSITREIQAYPSGLVTIPFLLLFLAFLLDDKLVMCFVTGIVVASCFVTGDMLEGSNALFTVYLVQALSGDNVRTMLFIIFFVGYVGVLQKAGGFHGWVQLVSRYCQTNRTMQGVTVILGSLLCFDEILSVLATGEALRAVSDSVQGSRQKLAFLIDMTTMSSVLPISAMTGLVLSILSRELVRLDHQDATRLPLDILLNGLQYAHYPILMMALVILLVITQRDFGPMLVAERKAIVRNTQEAAVEVESSVLPDGQPARWWIFALPMAGLAVSGYLMLLTSGNEGNDGSSERGFYKRLEDSTLLPSLLKTMSTIVTVSLVAFKLTCSLSGERMSFGPWYILNSLLKRRNKNEDSPRSLVSIDDFIRTLMVTAGRSFPTMIILVFSWATSIALSDAGVGNLTARWLVGVDSDVLPTAGFVVAALFALLTGNEILALSALIPLTLESALDRSHSTASATVGAIISGALAGRQLSPIAQTTILVASASGCTVRGHLATQAPYVLLVFTVTILLSVFPSWPNVLSIIIGLSIVALFVFVVCIPIVSSNGRYDFMTELCGKKNNDLSLLRTETVELFAKKSRKEEATRTNETALTDPQQLDAISYAEKDLSEFLWCGSQLIAALLSALEIGYNDTSPSC